jgi:hypothetical protein
VLLRTLVSLTEERKVRERCDGCKWGEERRTDTYAEYMGTDCVDEFDNALCNYIICVRTRGQTEDKGRERTFASLCAAWDWVDMDDV